MVLSRLFRPDSDRDEDSNALNYMMAAVLVRNTLSGGVKNVCALINIKACVTPVFLSHFQIIIIKKLNSDINRCSID